MVSIPVPVSLTSDLTLGASLHDLAKPPDFAQPLAPSVEGPACMGAPLGSDSHSHTASVRHEYMPIILADHDLGAWLPDATLVQPNLMTPVTMAFTSRKPTVWSSSVEMEGIPAACTFPVVLPLLSCGDPVSIPQSHRMTPLHSVHVGMTPGDVLAGALNVARIMALDLLVGRAASRLANKAHKLARRAARVLRTHGTQGHRQLADGIERMLTLSRGPSSRRALRNATPEEVVEELVDRRAKQVVSVVEGGLQKAKLTPAMVAKSALAEATDFSPSGQKDGNPTAGAGGEHPDASSAGASQGPPPSDAGSFDSPPGALELP